MAELSQRRKEMQNMLLAPDTSQLQLGLFLVMKKDFTKKNGALAASLASPTIEHASKVMAAALHSKTTELETSGQLATMNNQEFVGSLLIASDAALRSDPETQEYAETITGVSGGNIDVTSDRYKQLISMTTDDSTPPVLGAGQQQPAVTVDDFDFSQLFGNLFTLHETLKQNPELAAFFMKLTPAQVQNSKKGQELQVTLANKIKQEAKEKYSLDVTENQARTASRIMLTEFTKWGSSYYPDIQKKVTQGDPLQDGEVNELLSVLATNTRVALTNNADALGELGSKEAIDALVGTGNSRGSVGLNASNIGFMMLSSPNLADANVQALAERSARDSLTVTGELNDDAISAGINSLPSAIRSNDGILLGINQTTKNFLTNAARDAKENCYDEGWSGGFWRVLEAISTFFSCLLNSWDFSAAIKSAMEVFDSERIEYKNRTKFESSYVNAITNASATELGYTGDPALLNDYKQYLATSSTQRIFESTAGTPHMEDAAITGTGNVPARSVPPMARSLPPSSEYYPGISTAPMTAGQPGKAAYDAWAAASKGDADPTAVYIQRNGETPLLVTTMSDAAANTGPYKFDPQYHDAIAKAAKDATSRVNEVVVLRDLNGNEVIEKDEVFTQPKSEIAAQKTAVEIVTPGR